MIQLRNVVSVCFVLTLAGCGAAPPASYEVSHDSTLSRESGVLLIADVCIQRDGIGESGDYFVIEESRYGAETSLVALRSYVTDSGIPIRGEIPTVCAAAHGDKTTIRVSTRSGGEISESTQPVDADPSIMTDQEYLNALSLVSTYAFERAAVDSQDTSKASEPAVKPSVTELKFLAAADIVRARTGAASVLFLGILGTSRTGMKAAAQGIGKGLVGMVTAAATAGLGVGFYGWFIPGHKISGRILEGALIDLESGELTWSNAVRVSGNPIKKKIWSNRAPLDLLFHDVLFRRTPSN